MLNFLQTAEQRDLVAIYFDWSNQARGIQNPDWQLYPSICSYLVEHDLVAQLDLAELAAVLATEEVDGVAGEGAAARILHVIRHGRDLIPLIVLDIVLLAQGCQTVSRVIIVCCFDRVTTKSTYNLILLLVDTNHTTECKNELLVKAYGETASAIQHGAFWVAHVHFVISLELEDFQLVAVVCEEVRHMSMGVVQAS